MRKTTVALIALCAAACGGSSKAPKPEAPHDLSYTRSSAGYLQGEPIEPNLATVVGPVTTFAIDPALPPGLTLDPATGTISGTPALAQARHGLTVTATGPGGAATATLWLSVEPPGHRSAKVVHFFDAAGWGAVELLARADGGGWPAGGTSMTAEGGGWFRGTVAEAAAAQVAFEGGGVRFPADLEDAFRLSADEVWVKGGLLFTADPAAGPREDELTVLTLNLHTYQEDGAAAKLDHIADTIAALRPDLVCLQECAQHAGAAGVTDPRAHLTSPDAELLRTDNMARRIAARLAEVHGFETGYAWGWAHIGFSVYEEGDAVLSPHPFASWADTYVSTSTSRYDPLGSRKTVHAAITLPGGAVVNAFSTHLSAGSIQDGQIDALRAWIAAKAVNGAGASITCGDFNMDAGTAGHLRMEGVFGGDPHVDGYWQANPEGFSDPTIGGGGGRIDYVFHRAGDALEPVTAQRHFLSEVGLGGRVSDHAGVIVRYRWVP